jgi:hypothetical protein
MKKQIVSLCVAILMCLSLFNCAGGGKTVESLTVVEGDSITAYANDRDIQLTVKVQYSGEAERAATSADATVNNGGLITIVAAGSTDIKAESKRNNASGNKISQMVRLMTCTFIVCRLFYPNSTPFALFSAFLSVLPCCLPKLPLSRYLDQLTLSFPQD